MSSTAARWTVRDLYLVSAFVHIALILHGVVQDYFSEFKYTDIDYAVITESGAAMLLPPPPQHEFPFFINDPSPYARTTYRYTPLLAILSLPNVILGALATKLLFACFTFVTAYYIKKTLQYRGVPPRAGRILLGLWLFNPVVLQVATRGSPECIITSLVVATLFYVITNCPIRAGVCLGLAVHMKMYPVIYAFPLLFSMDNHFRLKTFKNEILYDVKLNGEVTFKKLPKETWKLFLTFLKVPFRTIYFMLRHLRRHQWTFGFTALITAVTLTGLFYFKYGWIFLYESYIYHGVRHDHRHNLSPFSQWATLLADRRYGDYEQSRLAFKLTQKLAQLPLTLILSFWFVGYGVELSMFLSTLAFVTFNSVATAQYFLWYLCLLPLAFGLMPRVIHRADNWWFWAKLFVVILVWFCTEINWVVWSYIFEYRGESKAFTGLFTATWLFALANVLMMNFTILSHVDVVNLLLPSKKIL